VTLKKPERASVQVFFYQTSEPVWFLKLWAEGGFKATAEAASPQVGAARPGLRPLVVSPGYCLPSSLLLAPWVFWQNRIFAIFSGIFPKSRISAQKETPEQFY
jgi:hypothetical protein